VTFTYQNDEAHSEFSILESLGGGVGLLDFDQDGQLDVFLPGGGTFASAGPTGRPSALYQNRGNWAFDDVTVAAGCGPSRHYSHGAAVADYDEDGFPDVLITGYGGVTLFRNLGDGTFVDATQHAQLDDRLWSSSAAWGDFNGDGVLDVFLVHYVDWSPEKNPPCDGPPGHPRDVCPPRQFQGLPDSVYFGNGDGTLRQATAEAGLQPDGKGLGIVVADLDGDRDLDVYVTNDTVANFLYQNDGRGRLEDVALTSGTAFSERGTPDGSMGIDASDFNGDAKIDLWVANYERENNALYRSVGSGLFRHVSQSLGIAALGATYVGWGTRFTDMDLDGDEDLMVANGHVIRFPQSSPRRQRPLLLENRDSARFVNVADGAGDYFQAVHEGRGLAAGDLDGDGDEDIVVSHMNEAAALLANETPSQGHWLRVRLIGRQSTRTPIGATVTARVGSRQIQRQLRGGSSFASTSDPTLLIGLGTADVVDELTLTWPAGTRLVLTQVLSNQLLTVCEPVAAP